MKKEEEKAKKELSKEERDAAKIKDKLQRKRKSGRRSTPKK